MVGRTSVWSVHTSPVTPSCRMPGPTMPSQVTMMSDCTSPWFHAKAGFSTTHGWLQLGAPGKRK